MTARLVDGYTRRMMNNDTYPTHAGPMRPFYIIRLQGCLDIRWSDWFDGMTITHTGTPPAETVLSGYVVDQAALHGLLAKIRDLNLPIIAVNRVSANGSLDGDGVFDPPPPPDRRS